VGKKRVGRYAKEFRRMAVERLKNCDNIVALAHELGVNRRLLYKWRDQLDPAEIPEESPQTSRESTLRKEVSQLQRVLADKALEVDFFKRCLAKSRGSTPAERKLWREGIYDQIREMMPMQGSDGRANVSVGAGESREFRSFSARRTAGGRRHGSTISDSKPRKWWTRKFRERGSRRRGHSSERPCGMPMRWERSELLASWAPTRSTSTATTSVGSHLSGAR
jgi:transposase-like protein